MTNTATPQPAPRLIDPDAVVAHVEKGATSEQSGHGHPHGDRRRHLRVARGHPGLHHFGRRLEGLRPRLPHEPAPAVQRGRRHRSRAVQLFYLLVLTLVISIPLSLGAAIFLVEYAPDNWVTRAVKTAIEVLSSPASIVVGFPALQLQMAGASIISGARPSRCSISPSCCA